LRDGNQDCKWEENRQHTKMPFATT
jgi:hypothetical protein